MVLRKRLQTPPQQAANYQRSGKKNPFHGSFSMPKPVPHLGHKLRTNAPATWRHCAVEKAARRLSRLSGVR